MRTIVFTVSAKRNAGKAVFLVLNHVSGSASTTSVPTFALSRATGLAAMFPVIRCFPVVIPVLDFVESPAQRSALFVTMRNSLRSFLAMRMTQMLDL